MDVNSASRDRLRSKNIGGVGGVKADRGDADTSAEKFTSGLGSGKAAKGGGVGMPKQDPGETASAYGERVRKWRAQQKALQGL